MDSPDHSFRTGCIVGFFALLCVMVAIYLQLGGYWHGGCC